MNEVKTWLHSRKGPITGRVVAEMDEWVDIQLVGDQSIRYYGAAGRIDGATNDGETIRARRSFLTEVAA